MVGDVKVTEFTAAHAAFLKRKERKPLPARLSIAAWPFSATCFTFALRTKGIIQIHPMARYGRIPEDEKALRVMDLEEERSLVNAVLAKNHFIGWYVGVLGETALRMTEGLLLKWKFVNLGERNLTVEASKNYKTCHVPLSDYAIELLRSLPRVIGCEYVFALALTKDG
jgi:integrase